MAKEDTRFQIGKFIKNVIIPNQKKVGRISESASACRHQVDACTRMRFAYPPYEDVALFVTAAARSPGPSPS
jgi:hypothetical protein